MRIPSAPSQHVTAPASRGQQRVSQYSWHSATTSPWPPVGASVARPSAAMAAPAAKRQRSAGTAAGAAEGVVRVGVNGFGRIGRLITRIVFQRDDPRCVPAPSPPAQQPQRPAPD